MISIRRSVFIWSTAVLTVVSLLAFILTYEMALREANGFLDGQLRQIALAVGIEGTPAPLIDESLDPEDVFRTEIWTMQGQRIGTPVAPESLPLLQTPGLATITFQGEIWRVCRVDRQNRIVQVGQRQEVRSEMAESAALEAGLPILLAIPLSWLVMGWGLNRVFARLTRVEQAIAERAVDSSEPIPVAEAPREVLPMVAAMNDLIDRMRLTLERQRRFVSDAAHQLRTPLAALQIQLDTLLRRQGNDPTLAEMESGIRRAATLVDRLLQAARLEEDRIPDSAPIDLTALVTQCVADFVPVADAKDLDLGLIANDPVVLTGVSAELEMLFSNLIENAVRYTLNGGQIDVAVRSLGSTAIVEIADTGPGIAEDALPHVFERFFRAAPQDADGSGLGLSIVAAVARRHGFRVNLANRPEGGLLVNVEIEPLILS